MEYYKLGLFSIFSSMTLYSLWCHYSWVKGMYGSPRLLLPMQSHVFQNSVTLGAFVTMFFSIS